jgi:transposase
MIRSKNKTYTLRLEMVKHAKTHGIRPAMRAFACSRNTVRLWLRRFQAEAREARTAPPGSPAGAGPWRASSVNEFFFPLSPFLS